MELNNLIKNSYVQKYDEKIKNWSRTTNGAINRSYFATNNSDIENTNIYNKEIDGINFILFFETQSKENRNKFTKKELWQTQQAKEFFKLRAKLWDELRREGARFSKERMILLTTLERIADSFYQKNRGIVELGRMNAELGIITENADRIYPEYTRISKLIEQETFYEKRKQKELSESEERNLKYYRERVQRNRAEKAVATEKSSVVKSIGDSSARKTINKRITRVKDR